MPVSYVAGDDSWETQYCVKATQVEPKEAKRFVTSHIKQLMNFKKFKDISAGIYCNEVPLPQFARQAGNIKLAEKLER